MTIYKRESKHHDALVQVLLHECNSVGANLCVSSDGQWISIVGYSLIPADIVTMLKLWKPEIIEYLHRRRDWRE